MRLLLLVWTADHPGQCKTGKFLNQGKCACLRCKLAGEHLENSTNIHTIIMDKIACILGTLGDRESLNHSLRMFLILKKPLPGCLFFTSTLTLFMDLTF